jgi:hypothetical protein
MTAKQIRQGVWLVRWNGKSVVVMACAHTDAICRVFCAAFLEEINITATEPQTL